MAEQRKFTMLVVSKSEKTTESLAEILAPHRVIPTFRADTAGKARRMTFDQNPDFVAINTPLADNLGTQLAIDLAERNYCVMIFVKNELTGQIAYKVEKYGVITIPKPVEKTYLIQSVKLLKAMRMKIEKLEKKNLSLETKMKEIRMVNRAKWLLIDHLKMSEDEAHRYIEKSAMDQCVSRGDIAENIIRLYGA